MDLYTLHSNPESLLFHKELAEEIIFRNVQKLIDELGKVQNGAGSWDRNAIYSAIRSLSAHRGKKSLVSLLKQHVFDAVYKADWFNEEVIVCDFVEMILQARWPEMEELMLEIGTDGWDEYVETLEHLGIEPPSEEGQHGSL